MGKCLPYVDSYLLFLFLDRTIKRGFSIRILTRNTCEIGNNLKETDTMSLILKYNESFYDILLKYFTTLSEITNIFKFIATTGFIVVVSFILNYIHDYRSKRITNESKYDLLELQKFNTYNRVIARHQSIISHKEMLNALEYATDKCYDKFYALKCIDIIVNCPQLVNVKSLPYGLTPFHRVCFQGHKCLIAFMLAKGADPSLVTTIGENALCMAIYYFLNNPVDDDFSCLEMIAKTGCGFGFEDKWYNSLLEMAFNNNHIKLVQWLILHHKLSSRKSLRCFSTPPI
ncbi:uncharacterized protein LOC117235100 isoform X1 [Bombus vosnesenskii]|uniref:Uncharacterized protein LOC117235100 isoform X1 n=1 Tax=Bombus vosnesenskii TaxID=207650 RepID=A0A6J3KKB2_9HYME|nr:uncharacterized protein LOC117235100 isoform X1 [Bombus vosnesenskii]